MNFDNLNWDNMLTGNYNQSKAPKYGKADLFQSINKFMSSPYGQPTAGEKAGMSSLNRLGDMRGGMKSPQMQSMLGKGMSQIAGMQGQAQNQSLYGMSKAGVGGGMAAERIARMGESAQDKLANLGTDVTMKSADMARQGELDYAAQDRAMDFARKAAQQQGLQLGIAELQAMGDKYAADMGAYAAAKGSEHGGLLESVIDAYTYGMGGDLYANLRRG